METTNSILDGSLYSAITPQSVLSWIRAIVANRMSSNGDAWTYHFSMYNSGTYNNQWMVVDYKEFVPGSPVQSNTLWIVEQIPGFCERFVIRPHCINLTRGDVSDVLAKQGYWASYNVLFK